MSVFCHENQCCIYTVMSMSQFLSALCHENDIMSCQNFYKVDSSDVENLVGLLSASSGAGLLASKMSKWNKTQSETMINLYRENPILYDPKHEFYTDRIKKRVVLKEMVAKFKEVRPGTTEKDILTKIRTLRTQYMAEKHKMRKSGMKPDEECVPTLWCFDQLNFLENYVQPKEEKRNRYNLEGFGYSNNIQTSESLKEGLNENSTNTSLEDQFPRKKMKTAKNLENKTIRRTLRKSLKVKHINLAKTFVAKMSEKNGQNHSFCKFMEEELNTIDDNDILDDVKWQIQNCVRLAKIKMKENRKKQHSSFLSG